MTERLVQTEEEATTKLQCQSAYGVWLAKVDQNTVWYIMLYVYGGLIFYST